MLDNIMNNNITLLAARPGCGKMAVTSELIYNNSIIDNKKTLIFSLTGNDSYYVTHLLSRISSIPHMKVYSYFHPTSCARKDLLGIDRDKFIDSIEMIQESDLEILCSPMTNDDYLDFLISYNDNESFDLIIIDNLEELNSSSKYDIKDILSKLKNSCKEHNTSLLIWGNLSREVERWNNRKIRLKDVNNYHVIKEYIDNLIILKRDYDKISVKNYLEENTINTYELEYDFELDKITEVKWK